MSKRSFFALSLSGAMLFCESVLAAGYAIGPFPANSVLGPNGPVTIPAAVQQFIQSNPSASVSAVNQAGQMIVNVPTNAPISPGYIYVYLPAPAYGAPAGMTLISETQWGAYSINNSGQIAGSNGDDWEIWNIGGGQGYLAPPVYAAFAGIAEQVNDSGQAITQNFDFENDTGHVYISSPTALNGYSAGLTDLTPQGSEYDIPLAIAINNHGDALYDAAPVTYYGDPSAVFQAYLRIGSSHNGLSTTTYTLSGIGWSMYQAVGLNDSGQVVGMATFTNGITSYNDPVYWRRGAVTDLNSLLPDNSGWVLKTVGGIDQLGDIEGTGLYNGVTAQFILWVPEPMPSGLLVAAASLYFTRRRWRR